MVAVLGPFLGGCSFRPFFGWLQFRALFWVVADSGPFLCSCSSGPFFGWLQFQVHFWVVAVPGPFLGGCSSGPILGGCSSWPIFGLIAGQGSLASVSNYIFWLRNGNLVFELATSTLNIFIGSFVRTTTYSKMITSLYSSGSHWAGRTPPNPIRSASLAAVAAAAQRIQMLSGSAAKDFLAKS